MVKKNGAFIVSLIVIISVLIGGIFVFRPIGFGITTTPGDTFLCPPDKFCDVIPILKCTTEQIDQRVILRTNAAGFSGSDLTENGVWIALDTDGDGGLEGYLKTTSQSSCLAGRSGTVSFFDNIYSRSGIIYVCPDSSKSFKYQRTGLANTDITPVPSFRDRNQEKYEGLTSLFSCRREIFKNDIKIGELSYDSNVQTPPSGITEGTFSLSENDVLESRQVFGTNGGSSSLQVEVRDRPITICQVNGDEISIGDQICLNENTLVKCIVAPDGTEIFRDPSSTIARCVDGTWVDAYNADFNIRDTSILEDESFIIDFTLQEAVDTGQIRQVEAFLTDNNIIEDEIRIGIINGKATIELEPDSTGASKEITISMKHPDGDFLPDEIRVTVGSALTVDLISTSILQFDADDIVVIVKVTKGDQAFEPNKIVADAQYNGQSVSEKSILFQSTPGVFHILYDLEGNGNLVVDVFAEHLGIESDIVQKDIEVKKTGIVIKPFGIPAFASCNQQSHTAGFTITDEAGNKIDNAAIVMTVSDADGDVFTPSITGKGDGKYEYTLFYGQGGLWTARLQASKGFITGELKTPVGFNIQECSAGGGGDPDCDPAIEDCAIDEPFNITVWLIGGGFVLAIGLFIFFVFVRKRK